MAVYPPPLIQSDIFNSALFSASKTAIVSGGTPPTPTPGTYVDFPEPQGELTFLDGTGVRTTISASALTLSQNIGISADGVGFNAVGIAYQPPSGDPALVSWENLTTKVEAVQALTQATDATTLNVNNAVQIQNGETISNPTQFITIRSDNSGNRISLDGDYGTSGQVLLSGGENGNLSWGTGGGGGVGTIAEVLTEGSNANGNNMTNINEFQANFYVNVNPSITGIGQSVLRYNQLDFYNPDNSNAPNSTMDIDHISIDKPDGVWARLNNYTGQPPTLILKSATRQLELSPNGFYINGFGTENQVLTRTAVDNEFEWADAAGGNQTLQEVCGGVGSTAEIVDTVIVSKSLDLTNSLTLNSGSLVMSVPDPLDPLSQVTALNMDSMSINIIDPANSLVSNYMSATDIGLGQTDTETGDNNSTTISANGITLSLQNNDFPENPEPVTTINNQTISIKTDQQDRDDSQTTILGQHILNYQQILNQESKDLLQLNANFLKMYDITTQTELVNLQNENDLNGKLTLKSTENTNELSLTNTTLAFNSVFEGDGWSIGLSTGGSNNLTITQEGTANGYLDLNFNELLIRGGAGNAGQVLTSGGTNNSFTWTTPASSGWVGTATSNLNMGTYDITSTSGTLDISATDIQITGQANFVSPPHIPEPILGNDAASKGYVDSLVGQYSGGFNLFMNYSNTDPTYTTFKELSPLVDSASQQTVPINLTTNSPFLLSQFITAPLGITEIPIGLWDLFLYALVDTAQDSTNTYFELWKRPAVGADVLLGTSGLSGDINNTNNPTSYSMSLTISTTITLALTDRVYIKIYGQTTHNNTVVLTTYYEGVSYSFLQTTLNSGTTLLSSNNTWTGTNNFVLPPTTPSNPTPANTDIINYGDIVDYVGSNYPIVSTLEYYISTTSPYFQYPPAPPTTALIQSYQYYGWYFINSVVARNISWYFAPDYAMTVGDVRGLYMNYINITTTSNDNLPYISIYTKPIGTNDVIPGFAHSVATYIPNFTPAAATPYCSFMNITGTQPDPFPYGHILGSMILSPVQPSPRGQYLPTEEVLAVAVGTSTGSSVNQVNFIMSKVGICLEQGNQELILNPQNISEQPTLSTVLGFGSVASNQSISGVNNLSATSITTPTLANGAATLTIGATGQITNVLGTLQNNGTALPAYISATGVASGAIDMSANAITNCPRVDSATALALGGTTATGVNVGRSAQTTNLLGNVQINSSSGTSGQVLTSTGASTAPTFQALPTPYISASGVASGSVNMGGNFIDNCAVIDNATEIGVGTITTTGVNVGRLTKPTNLIGNVRINGTSGTSGQVLTSTGASSAPTWQALPTPYISASGVSSGAIDMGNFGIINSGGLDASGTPVSIGQASASLGVSLGRATQTTNINGNVTINSSAGTSGQVLTSTGASSAPTWQALPAAALSPSVQSNITASAISLSVGIAKCRQLDITIVSGAKYLISGSFVVYSSGSAPQQNTTTMYMGIGQQAVTASPSVVSSIPITTNTGFMNSPVINEDTCLSCVQFQNYPAEMYTLANTYVWTAPAAAAGSRTFALWARAGGTITTSIITVNYTLSVTRIV